LENRAVSQEANLVVVLSSYNGARFIAEQIESIRQQTRRSWVLLVRDDGSRDDTVRIVETHSAADPRIVLLRDGRGNLGAAASFSALLEHAAGAGAEYVALCDQDDVWRPDKLERELQLMEEHERMVGRDVPLLVHSDLTVVDQDLRIVHPSFVSYQKLGRESVRPLRRLLVQNFVTGCTTVLNRALLRAAVPLPPVVMHDWWLALCAGALGQLLYLAEPTVLYRQHARNTLGAPGWRRLISESLRRPVELWWRRGNANLADAVDQACELAVRIERHGRETSVTHPSLSVVRDFCSAFAGDGDSLSRMRTMFRHGIRPRSLLGFPLAFYGRTLLWRRTSVQRTAPA
jgi:rhamnosyltransferase